MRPIDADVLKDGLLEAIKDAPLYIQATVDQYIDETPTLTSQNEPLTCAGCNMRGKKVSPCENCIRDPRVCDYYTR